MKNMKMICFFMFLIILAPLIAKAENGRHILLVSGETHAMLKSCDCENEPGGGFAGRATLIDSIRRSSAVMLVDAGGFSGGGIYDLYTEGRNNDSIRTIAAIKAMGAMGYDAVAIGDDDLQYGFLWLAAQSNEANLPLVCANCSTNADTGHIPEYRIIERDGIRYGITAVVTAEAGVLNDAGFAVQDPVMSLEKIMPVLDSSSDCRVILSHLGEDESRRIAEKFPSCRIIVNGHRKHSTSAGTVENGKSMVQFGFQGKKLTSVEIAKKNNSIVPVRINWLPVDSSISPDSGISRIINSVISQKGISESVLDLYIMSDCPYGLDAVGEVFTVTNYFHQAIVNLWFMGHVSSTGEIVSSSGDTDAVFEEMLWLGVKSLFPEFYRDYCLLKAETGLPGWNLVQQMGLDSVSLGEWVEKQGRLTLKLHYNRSDRLSVSSSPMLFFNNSRLSIAASKLRIADFLCQNNTGKSVLCDSMPECFDNFDCRKPEFHGECIGEDGHGKCRHSSASKFEFILVRPSSSFYDYSKDPALNTTAELFPGSIIKTVFSDSREGKRLVKKIKPDALPFYAIGTGVKTDLNYGKIKDGLIETNGWLTFKPGIIKKMFFQKRPASAKVTFFIDPLLPNINSVISFIKESDIKNGFKILPIILSNPADTSIDSLETERRAMALKWLSGKKAGSVHISQKKLKLLWKELEELEIGGPVEVLYMNRELIPVKSQDELSLVLRYMSGNAGTDAK